jgi:hypothetical protein
MYMRKKIIIVLSCILVVLLLNLIKTDITPVFHQQTEKVNDEMILLASISEKDTFLYASQQENGGYKNMTLKIGKNDKEFDWINDTNPNFAPKLKYIEQYKNGIRTEELIVLLSLPGGVGIDITEIHIINPETMEEVQVDDPIKAIYDNVEMEISQEGLKVVINDVIHLIPDEIIPISKFPYEKPLIGNYVVYELNEEAFSGTTNLTVKVGIELSMNVRMGLIKIYYTFNNNKYEITNMEFQLDYLY